MTRGLNAKFVDTLIDLKNNGVVTRPRGMECKEILNYTIVLDDPRNRVITWNSRKTSYKYLLAELVWYLSGSNEVDAIKEYAPFWSQILNPDNKTVNSAYGYRIFGKAPFIPFNQWDKIKEILRKDSDSRQALLHINHPIDYTYANKDVPCTLSLQFFIRQNELHLRVDMRSNDIILGFTNDVFQFTMLQELMLCELKREEQFEHLTLGKYYHNAASMHVYDRHYQMVDNLIGEATDKLSEVADAYEKAGIRSSNLSETIENIRAAAYNEHMMVEMEINDTTIEDLISIEKQWRENSKCNKAFNFSELVEFNRLPQYWQTLIKSCFNEVYIDEPMDLVRLVEEQYCGEEVNA